MRTEEPTMVYKVTFQHVHFASGFALSAEVAGKEYKPKSRHACMECGYWCSSQIREQGYGVIGKFIHRKTIGNLRLLLYRLF